jgi:glucose/arabinose dehydrogenase
MSGANLSGKASGKASGNGSGKATGNGSDFRRLAAFAGVLAATGTAAFALIPETLNPGLSIVNLRPDETFKPMVTGLGFLSDGRLVVSHWGGIHTNVDKLQTAGKVYILSGVTGDTPKVTVSTYAETLQDPVGMLVKDDKIYVTGGEQLIELPDANGDGKAEAAKVICKIPGTHARHEFLFGLVYKDGKFWMNPSSAKDAIGGTTAWSQANPNRGTTLSVDPATGAYEVFAMGLREPNGMGIGPENELFVPDVQGNWLPANKLINVRKGRFYGFKHEPAETWDTQKEYPPAVYLPQGDVAQAPGTPLYINKGNLPGDRFVGQMLLGDAVNGGIRRVFLDKVNGEFQGAVFAFTGGTEAGPNRMAWGPDGYLYVGMCGQGAPDWAYKKDFGLQKIKPNGKDVFEMVAVRSRAGGLEIEFTHEPNAAALSAASYNIGSWYYLPTSAYGGGAQGRKSNIGVGAIQQSTDKKSVFLPIANLEGPFNGNGRVYDIKLTGIASASGVSLWTQEAWYTMNSISTSRPFEPTVKLAAPSPAFEDAFRMRASSGRLELAARLGGILSGAEVRNTRGEVVAQADGAGRTNLEIPTAGWASGIYMVTVRSGAKTHRRAVAIP